MDYLPPFYMASHSCAFRAMGRSSLLLKNERVAIAEPVVDRFRQRSRPPIVMNIVLACSSAEYRRLLPSWHAETGEYRDD